MKTQNLIIGVLLTFIVISQFFTTNSKKLLKNEIKELRIENKELDKQLNLNKVKILQNEKQIELSNEKINLYERQYQDEVKKMQSLEVKYLALKNKPLTTNEKVAAIKLMINI